MTAIKSLALALPALSAEQSNQAATAIADGATQLYDSMQAIVSRLRPLAIDDLGLSASLRDMVDQARRTPGSPLIELQMKDADAVPAALRLTVFRIVQEALTNALRHANAKTILISLNVSQQQIDLSICDDGDGIASTAVGNSIAAPDRTGFGLRGMLERAEAVGGKLTLASGPRGGLNLHAELPVH